MNSVIESVIRQRPQHGDYDALPDAIKADLTPLEWSWLPAAQKATILQDYTEPPV